MLGRRKLKEGGEEEMKEYLDKTRQHTFPILLVGRYKKDPYGSVCYEKKDATDFMENHCKRFQVSEYTAYEMQVVKLLDGMLHPDPKQRFSLERVLSFPFFWDFENEDALFSTIRKRSGSSISDEDEKDILEYRGNTSEPDWKIAARFINKKRDNAHRIPEARILDYFVEEVILIEEKKTNESTKEKLKDVCRQGGDYRAVRNTDDEEDDKVPYFDYDEELRAVRSAQVEVEEYDRTKAVLKCFTTFEYGDDPIQTIALLLKLMTLFEAAVDTSDIKRGKILVKWPSLDEKDGGQDSKKSAEKNANNGGGGGLQTTNAPQKDAMEVEEKDTSKDNNGEKMEIVDEEEEKKRKKKEARRRRLENSPVVKASIEVFKHPTEVCESVVEVRDLSDNLDPSQFSKLLFDRILQHINEFNS